MVCFQSLLYQRGDRTYQKACVKNCPASIKVCSSPIDFCSTIFLGRNKIDPIPNSMGVVLPPVHALDETNVRIIRQSSKQCRCMTVKVAGLVYVLQDYKSHATSPAFKCLSSTVFDHYYGVTTMYSNMYRFYVFTDR